MDLQAADRQGELGEQAIDVGIGAGIAGGLSGHRPRDAAKAGEVEALGEIQQPLGGAVGEGTAQIAPARMALLAIVAVHHIKVVGAGVAPEPQGLLRGVLEVVVQVHHIPSPGVAIAGEHRLVFAKIAAVADQQGGQPAPGQGLAHPLRRVVGAAVIHEHHLPGLPGLQGR